MAGAVTGVAGVASSRVGNWVVAAALYVAPAAALLGLAMAVSVDTLGVRLAGLVILGVGAHVSWIGLVVFVLSPWRSGMPGSSAGPGRADVVGPPTD